MPILQEYIATLVSNITEARVSADKITSDIAKNMYQPGGVLEDFPIPHMRIGEVVMDIPVAIDFTSEHTTINRNPNVDDVTDLLFGKIYEKLGLEAPQGRSFGPPEDMPAVRVQNLIRDTFEDALRLAIEHNNLNDLSELSERLADAVVRAAGKNVLQEPEMEALINVINDVFRNSLLSSTLEDVGVLVTASDLKEKPPQTLLHIKLNIFEEGMEWAVSQNGNKLVPE